MFQYLSDDLRILYETDDPHPTLALWTGKGIDLVYLLNESGSTLPMCF